MKKFIIFVLCTVLLVPFAVKADDPKLAESAKSAILLEASTGEVLFEKNSHEKLHPASMTKMMSMLLVVEAIDKGLLSWDEMVTVSENASSMGGSQILLETNEKMSVSDLFKGVAVMSGNDAVVALAERVAGTEDAFVDAMNKRAQELGLQDTNFKNPHGLDAANHYSSAYDMAMIAKELVRHEKVLTYTSIYEDYLRADTDRKIWLVNTNKLVRFYEGVDGLKTGYTAEAGYCLTATAKKNGLRVIAVAMGEPDSKTRNAEISQMLDYAFAQYGMEQVLSKDSVLEVKEIMKGKKRFVEIVPSEEVSSLYKKTDGKKNLTYEVHSNSIKAPVKVGDIVGTLDIKQDGNTIRTVNITVKEDVPKANLWELFLRYLKDITTGELGI